MQRKWITRSVSIAAVITIAVLAFDVYIWYYRTKPTSQEPSTQQVQTAANTLKAETKIYTRTIVSLDTKVKERTRTIYVKTHNETTAMSDDGVAHSVRDELLFHLRESRDSGTDTADGVNND